VPTKTNFRRGLSKDSEREFATSRRRFAAPTAFALLQYLVFAYRAVAWYTAAMHLFSRWMWIEPSHFMWTQWKLRNSFCDVIKGL